MGLDFNAMRKSRKLAIKRTVPLLFAVVSIPFLALDILGSIVLFYIAILASFTTSIVNRKAHAVVDVIFASTFAYGCGPYISSLFDEIYFGASKENINELTITMLSAISFSYVVISLVMQIFSKRVNLSVKTSRLRVMEKSIKTPHAIFLATILLVTLVSIYQIYQVFFVYGLYKSLFLSQLVRQEILIPSSTYIQLIVIPSMIFLVSRTYKTPHDNFRVFVRLVIFATLIPLFLVSARKEILLIIIAVIPFLHLGKKAFALAIATVLLFLLQAAYRNIGYGAISFNDIILSSHEFVLPSYTFILTAESGPVIQQIIQNSSGYLTSFWGLLPNFLRLEQYVDFGSSFYSATSINIALGASPFADIYLDFADIVAPVFIVNLVIIFLGIFLLSKKIPEILFLSFPFLFILGRSTFSITVFFIVYSTLVLVLLNSFRGDRSYRAVSKTNPRTIKSTLS